ncbi:hypothetical protein COOONC_05411 [Cooperia oncophora]
MSSSMEVQVLSQPPLGKLNRLAVCGFESRGMSCDGTLSLQGTAVMKDSLWGEHELDYVVITRDLSLSRLTPNPSEVSDVRLVDEQELARWVATEPSSFSPWFLLFYRLRYLSEWWSKLDHIESYPVDMNIVRMN